MRQAASRITTSSLFAMDVDEGIPGDVGQRQQPQRSVSANRVRLAAPAVEALDEDMDRPVEPPSPAPVRHGSPLRAGGPRPLSNSRGRVNTFADLRPRAPSRGKSAGRRATRRFVNDTFAHAWGLVWDATMLNEAELADRLAHMQLSLPRYRPFLEPLTESRDLLRAFRRGEIGSLSDAPARAPTAAAGEITMRSLLQSWYGRVDKRIRPVLLKEARRSVRAASERKPSFLMALELLLQRFSDGTAGALPLGDLDALERELGEEFSSALQSPIRLEPDTEDEAADAPTTGTSALPPPRRLTLLLHFSENPFWRVLTHAVASFYSLRSQSWDDSVSGARLMRVRLPARHVGDSTATGQVNLGAPAVYQAARRQLAAVWSDGLAAAPHPHTSTGHAPTETGTDVAPSVRGDGSGSGPCLNAAPRAGSPLGDEPQPAPTKYAVTPEKVAPAPRQQQQEQPVARPSGTPLVPLLLLHVRTVSEASGGVGAKG